MISPANQLRTTFHRERRERNPDDSNEGAGYRFDWRGGPIKIGWKSTAAASVVRSERLKSFPMLDVPGWLENHKLPKAVAVVMALDMTARVSGEARRLVSPLRQAST